MQEEKVGIDVEGKSSSRQSAGRGSPQNAICVPLAGVALEVHIYHMHFPYTKRLL